MARRAQASETAHTASTSPFSTMACACTMQVASSTALYCPCPLPQWVPGNHCQVLYPRGGAGRGVLAAAADAGVTCVATAVNTTASQLRPAEYCTIQLPISSGRVLTRSPELPVRARRWRLGDYDLRVHLKSSTRIVPPPPAAGHRPPAISISAHRRRARRASPLPDPHRAIQAFRFIQIHDTRSALTESCTATCTCTHTVSIVLLPWFDTRGCVVRALVLCEPLCAEEGTRAG